MACGPFSAEALENRTLFLAPDTSFGNGGLVHTRFEKNYNENPEHAVVLNYGLLVVEGTSTSIDGSDSNTVLAMYTSAGKLATGFNGNGKLVLPPPIATEVGKVNGLMKLADNGILVVGDHSLLKIKVNGKIDTTFGKNGLAVVPNYVPDEAFESEQAVITPDGQIKVGQYMPDVGLLSVATYGSTGKSTGALRRTIQKDGGQIYVTQAAEIIQFGTVLRKFRSNLQIESHFGVGGVFDIKPAFVVWAHHQKPWTDVYGDEPIAGIPDVHGYYTQAKTSLAGFTVQLEVDSTAKGLEYTTDHEYVQTLITANVSSYGDRVQFYTEHPKAAIYGHTYFAPLPSGSYNFLHFGGNIYVADGAHYTYEDKTTQDPAFLTANDAVMAPDGGYYIFGVLAHYGTDDANHFLIAKTIPVAYD